MPKVEIGNKHIARTVARTLHYLSFKMLTSIHIKEDTSMINFIIWLILGAIIGWLAGIVRGDREGTLLNIVIGIVGAFVGWFLFYLLWLCGWNINIIDLSICGVGLLFIRTSA